MKCGALLVTSALLLRGSAAAADVPTAVETPPPSGPATPIPSPAERAAGEARTGRTMLKIGLPLIGGGLVFGAVGVLFLGQNHQGPYSDANCGGCDAYGTIMVASAAVLVVVGSGLTLDGALRIRAVSKTASAPVTIAVGPGGVGLRWEL